MAKLSIDSLHFAYSRDKVLQGARIQCQTGDRIALSGINGSGKSTLLKILVGLLKPPFGALKIEDIYIPPARRFHYLAWLPQESFLPKGLLVKQAISLFSNKQQKASLLSDQRIQELGHRKINQLSGGEKRYLETSMVLSLDRDFFLLDEPFTEVEPIYRSLLFKKISSLSQQAGFILVDHNKDAMSRIATKQLLLSHGEIHPIKDLLKMEN